MSFYGSYQIVEGLRLNKRKFPPGNDELRFGNCIFVAAYNFKDHTSIGVVERDGLKIIYNNTDGVVVLALGPANNSIKITDCKIIDTLYDVTLQPNTHCVVLEGAASVIDVIYSSTKITSHIAASDEPQALSIFGQTKLLTFKVLRDV